VSSSSSSNTTLHFTFLSIDLLLLNCIILNKTPNICAMEEDDITAATVTGSSSENDSKDRKRFFVAVHVGAGYHSPSNHKPLRSAMNRACLAAASVLQHGSGLSLDAVVAAIQLLEVYQITLNNFFFISPLSC